MGKQSFVTDLNKEASFFLLLLSSMSKLILKYFINFNDSVNFESSSLCELTTAV